MSTAEATIIGIFLAMAVVGLLTLLVGLYLAAMSWWTEKTKNIPGIE